jgi:hypothetical protein
MQFQWVNLQPSNSSRRLPACAAKNASTLDPFSLEYALLLQGIKMQRDPHKHRTADKASRAGRNPPEFGKMINGYCFVDCANMVRRSAACRLNQPVRQADISRNHVVQGSTRLLAHSNKRRLHQLYWSTLEYYTPPSRPICKTPHTNQFKY